MRMLFYDIENAPILGYVWEAYDANLLHTVEDWYLLSVSYSWGLDGEVRFLRKGHKKGDDEALARRVWRLLDEADVVVAHNGDAFDSKKLAVRFLHYGLGPPSPYRQIDTLKEARRHFKFAKNNLDDLGRFLGVGQKVANQGMATWLGCMANRPDDWAVMEEYGNQDVELLREVYKRLLPYVGHPGRPSPGVNMQQWTGLNTCTKPACGSDQIHKRGRHRTQANVYQTYQCNTCGGYSRALLRDDGRMR